MKKGQRLSVVEAHRFLGFLATKPYRLPNMYTLKETGIVFSSGGNQIMGNRGYRTLLEDASWQPNQQRKDGGCC